MNTLAPLCLVVGGSGFVGRRLVQRLLTAGLRVRVFDRVNAHAGDARVAVHLGDLRDDAALMRAMPGVQCVFHTAAEICLTGVARPGLRQRVLDVNVGGTQRLLDTAERYGVRAFVFASSNNVCLDRACVDGDEQVPYAARWVDLYTESKVRAERLVLARDRAGGMRTCALRPGGLWGPGPGALMLEKFLTQVAAGRLVASIGDGRSVADNTHVENLVDALVLSRDALLERPGVAGGQAYFITDGEPMDPTEWFRPLWEGLGITPPRRRLDARLMYAVAYASEWLHFLTGRPPLLTRVEVLKVTRSHSFRIDKARRDLGYEPRVTLANGGIGECLPEARAYLAAARSA